MRLLTNLTAKMKKTVAILAVLSLAVCISTAASARALDYIPWTYVDDGEGRILTQIFDTGVGVRANISGQITLLNADQPNFKYGSFTGYGICIDWTAFLTDGVPNPNYKVYSWAKAGSNIGTINVANKQTIWNQLTTMWTEAVVITPTDRSALQVATWTIANNGLFTTLINDTGGNVQTQVTNYLAIAPKTIYRNNFVILADDGHNHQTLVAAVPEASTLIGFGSALIMVGPGMIGWLKRRRS